MKGDRNKVIERGEERDEGNRNKVMMKKLNRLWGVWFDWVCRQRHRLHAGLLIETRTVEF